MDCVVEHPYGSGQIVGSSAEPLRPGGLELTRRAIHLASFSAGQTILDLGCGDGAGTTLLCSAGCSVIALDLSAESLQRATTRLPSLAAVAASARRLPFADASLDGILAECSLSLAGYSQEVLTECHRVLRPGGHLAITDVFARAATTDMSQPACLGDMKGQDEILGGLMTAGFRIERWEDHSEVLKTFVARLIFECDSPNALWAATADDNPMALNKALRQRRPGYFLLLATRTSTEPPT